MIRLSHRDLDMCSRALQELYGEMSLEGFLDRLLPLLANLVPSGHLSYNEIDLRRERFVIRLYPERPEARKLLPLFGAHYQSHPLSEYYQETDGLPKRISDVATLRQFQQTAIYHEYYRLMDTRHQMVCFFHHQKDSHVGLAWNRRKNDFSQRDMDVVEFLSPHIARAYRNARVADAMAVRLEAIGEGLDTMRRAVILSSPDGRIRWQSSLAREWLREFFPNERTRERLPHSLCNWLKRMAGASPVHRPAFFEFQMPAGRDCRLVVYCGKPGSGGCVLVLTRERVKIDPAKAQSLGVTSREAEVLYWISEAKTRQEMARILGVSWRTIAKHMEHLFAKLGVENRLQAQRIGRELRGL